LGVTDFHLKGMSKRIGRSYEKLTQQIFAEALNSDDVRSIEVKHDVTLTGRTTDHQIDVYWEFERGGIKYITLVQAKDWATRVEQGELLKFKAVLDDLPNQPRGVFVTRTGYQKGRSLSPPHTAPWFMCCVNRQGQTFRKST
jgi:restriction endonuclease Mrr